MTGTCVICKKRLAKSKQHLSICHRSPCTSSYKSWCEANFDQLPDHNKHKVKFEDAFWEVTPSQRDHYSRFYELMRPRVKSKPRSCLRCRKPVGDGDSGTDFRLCSVCHAINVKYNDDKKYVV